MNVLVGDNFSRLTKSGPINFCTWNFLRKLSRLPIPVFVPS
jgi:hypothetical protein